MNKKKFEQLIRSIFAAKDQEILCSEFFELLPRFVDQELSRADVSALLPQVTHHLHQCPECHEVYQALLQAARLERESGDK